MAIIKQKDASTASPVLVTNAADTTAALPVTDWLPYTAGLEKSVKQTDWKKWAWIGGALLGAIVLYFLYKRFKK
ncbi:MAG TPA: hypothetical protein VL098_12700 [Flavipsychrobacter sp.]|nr:hypothetical protein [Flavipsychrobacter sp.]